MNTQLSLHQALAMLDVQDRLNALANPKWQEQNNHWLRGAWIATGDLLEADRALSKGQVFFEEIWRNIASEWLQGTPKDEDIEASAGLLVSTMYDEQYWSQAQKDRLKQETDFGLLADSFVHLASSSVLNIHLFARMMEIKGLSWDTLHKAIVVPGLRDIFTAALPDPENIWVDLWAESVALSLMDKEPRANVTELLNMMEVAYVEELQRRKA